MLPPDAGDILLPLARAAIGERWGQAPAPYSDAGWLHQPGASFVTLKLHGDLRGCIGTIEPHRSLAQDVRANAIAAAFEDTRFGALSPDELDAVRIEVSVLSPLEPLHFESRDEALGLLRPGVDGVLLACGRRRATFLPQMWARFRDPQTFIAHLTIKAGLPAGYWDDTMTLSRYAVTSWHEAPERAPVGTP